MPAAKSRLSNVTGIEPIALNGSMFDSPSVRVVRPPIVSAHLVTGRHDQVLQSLVPALSAKVIKSIRVRFPYVAPRGYADC